MKLRLGDLIKQRQLARVASTVVGAVLVTAALVLSPPSLHTTASAHADSSTTVSGPLTWIPDPNQNWNGGTDGTTHSTVTVDQTQLVSDQVLHVSWTGFTPTLQRGTTTSAISVPLDDPGTLYPVRVYQCRGTDPNITDCYGSSHYGQDPTLGFQQPSSPPGTDTPEFPSNMVLAVTRADGTGDAYIEVWPSNQSQTLGCDASHQCSIVVEPNWGGDSTGGDTGVFNCADHNTDNDGFYNSASDNVNVETDNTNPDNSDGEQCAWADRVVVPISFAPAAGDCAAAKADFSAEGLPMVDRAMSQWTPGLCLARTNPLNVQYSTGLTEPQARADFLAGIHSDVALTSLPADPSLPSAHPYTYAPLANAGIAVVFLVDDPTNGRQIRSMKLDARLVAKLLTQSYDVYGFSGGPITASVNGNPFCIFDDPEFLHLNPTGEAFTWPSCNSNSAIAQGSLPIVTGGNTDLVTQLTTWIESDADARAFLRGAPDSWGMHVNTFYQAPKVSYPVGSIIVQDASGPPLDPGTGLPWDPASQNRDFAHRDQFEWNPAQSGLDQVFRDAALNTPTCLQAIFDATSNQHDKCAPESVGLRGMFAVLDTGRAASGQLPTAALENADNQFVQPTASALTAAANDMTTDAATGTQSLPYNDSTSPYATDAAAYPLSTVQYAMVPTGGIDATKASKIAQFVTDVTSSGGGQAPGIAPGQLAVGFAPLTPGQQAQAATAAAKVLAQKPTSPSSSPPTTSAAASASRGGSGGTSGGGQGTTGGGTGGGFTGGTTSGGLLPSGSISATPSHSSGTVAGQTTTPSATRSIPFAVAGSPSPDQAGLTRILLPILLIVGLILLVGGPVAMVLSAARPAAKTRKG